MLQIKVPATSANIGVGFDALGIAFNLFNVYNFEPSKTFELIGFDEAYNNQDNLVLRSYQRFASTYKNDIQPVAITQLKQDIPIARGLGSSASLILAGVVAANQINQLGKTKQECAQFAANLEGHPDNVFAAMFGSVTAAFIEETETVYDVFPISNALHFTLLIPSVYGETSTLRDQLPNDIPLQDTVFHLSRMIHVPSAFMNSDIGKLKKVLKDKIHEQIRYLSIPEYHTLLAIKEELDEVMVISGSGPTVLLIGDKPFDRQLPISIASQFQIVPVTISDGLRMEEIK